jgi:hypothetical protein
MTYPPPVDSFVYRLVHQSRSDRNPYIMVRLYGVMLFGVARFAQARTGRRGCLDPEKMG